jgi:Uma2 family endonuclease
MYSPALMTAEALLVEQPPNKSTELVRGRMIVREPPSALHGLYSAQLCFLLLQHVHPARLGVVFGQDTGFQIASDPDTVLAPDLAFISTARVAQIPAVGYAKMVPDLVAEIISPGDRRAAVRRKVADWLRAGVRVVWVIDPVRTEARIYGGNGTERVVPSDGDLTGDDVLPGFRCPLAAVFE